MAARDTGAHNEACATASARSTCECDCNGARHAEGMGAYRAKRAAAAATATVRGGDGQYRRAAPEPEPSPALVSRSAPPTPDRLREYSDDDLADLFARYSAEEDWDAMEAVVVEMDRRESEPEPVVDPLVDPGPPVREKTGIAWLDGPGDDAAEQWGDLTDGGDSDTSRRLDELLARGYDWPTAYAEVHGLDADEVRRQELTAAIDADRQAGETRERAVRRAYDTHVHERFLVAESATRGNMLSAAGVRAGVHPLELFSGHADRARKYASPELLEWWADNGRQTYTDFRAAALGWRTDLASAAAAVGRGNDRDFGI